MGGRSVSPIRKSISSRTGKLQFIDQSNELYAQSRSKRAKRAMTEAGFDLVMAICIAASAGVVFLAKIAPGLPYVLTQHGVL